MLRSLLLLSFISFACYVEGQPSKQYLDSVWKLTNADYHDMLGKLHITTLRPPADGMNPNVPNAANYDESKANPYPDLPDPLVLRKGKPVRDSVTWWTQRRPEIMEDLDREIYGRVPDNVPAITWELQDLKHDTIGSIPVITRKLFGVADNSNYPAITVKIELIVSIPENHKDKVPMMMEFGFRFPPGFRMPAGMNPNMGKSWQEQVLEKGWGTAVMYPYSFQADNGAGLTQGIIGLDNRGERRKPDDWGTIRAWAWGASRVLDYFETDPAIDATRVGLDWSA